jgi:agmatine deiminase
MMKQGKEKTSIRLPAEWEPHEYTLLAWPANRSDWPGKIIPVHWVYGEIVRRVSESEKVLLLVRNLKQKHFVNSLLQKNGANLSNVQMKFFSGDRNWMRDSSAFFVERTKNKKTERAQVHFQFNAWAKYLNWKFDTKLPKFLEKTLNDPVIIPEVNKRRIVLEGGAVDSNGAGALLTTEECLLHPSIQVRNPEFSRQDYERIFKEYLGIRKVIWLKNGIAGDDTHGHIDDLCRFVNKDTVVLCREKNSSDENYPLLEKNYDRLIDERTADGSKLDIISLPMPHPLIFDGMRLPASYANFYIGNQYVLVPTFNDPMDRQALGILGELFPSRIVCGIHSVDLVWGLGTLHCLSHEIPSIKTSV